MNDFSYQQTLPLKLLPSYGRPDFIIGESNLEAVKWVDNFSKSKISGLVIIGPSASGKSHLISTLKNKYFRFKRSYYWKYRKNRKSLFFFTCY